MNARTETTNLLATPGALSRHAPLQQAATKSAANYTTAELLTRNRRRMAIARHVCVNPGQPRALVVKALDAPVSTAFGLIREMLVEGWLVEEDAEGQRGRVLRLPPERFFLLGLQLGSDGAQVMATSLDGQVMARRASDDALDLAQAARLLVEVHATLRTPERRAMSIALAAPGEGLAQQLAQCLRVTALQRVPVLTLGQTVADAALPLGAGPSFAQACRQLLADPALDDSCLV